VPEHLLRGSANKTRNNPENETNESTQERPFGGTYELFTTSQENPECDEAYRGIKNDMV
jgi:hypothetical protein